MMYEYAVSPGLFDRDSNLALLYQAFGMEPGRLVSDFPRKKWEQAARAIIDRHAGDELRRRAWVECLVALRKRALYERPGPQWNDTLSWIQNAIGEHTRMGRRSFHGILWEDAARPHADVIRLGPAMVGHPRWPTPHSSFVERRAASMLAAVAPLLDLSRMVVLIDRHFYPGEGKWVNFLMSVANYLCSGNSFHPVTQLKYVTSNLDMNVEAMKKLCSDLLPATLSRKMTLKFCIVPKELLHNRYVLTDRGAIQFGEGLDEGSGTVFVSRLGDAAFEQLWGNWTNWSGDGRPIAVTTFELSGLA